MDTIGIQYGYSTDTVRELGNFTYPKIAYVLCVFLYFCTILFSLSYKNSALGFPKVAVGTIIYKERALGGEIGSL